MIRWGILSTAKIAAEKVIPAIQAGTYCKVTAIASRNKEQASVKARQLGIPRSYGTYEELLNDKDIDAVYIPLPNNLHVPWAIKALEAGKHVLCEKPVGLTALEAQQLIEASAEFPKLKIMEAFMYRFHPQWQFAKKLADEGRIGELKTIQAFFSYYNADPANIRNRRETGGGGLMDIGCYCISQSRFIFGKEPERVLGMVEYDPEMGTDRIASAMLSFGRGTATFTCSTQAYPFQRFNIIGARGRIEIEIPVNTPADKPAHLWLHTSQHTEDIVFEPCNQYTLQADEFSKAILNNTPVPTGLTDALNNMKVIEAIIKSNEQGTWVVPA